MQSRINQNFAITEAVRVGNAEFVLGENTKAPNSFVTWQCRDGDDNFFGHYFNSRLSAQKDLYYRAVEDIKFLETMKKRHREERKFYYVLKMNCLYGLLVRNQI